MQEWNRQRTMAIERSLNQFLYVQMAKELKNKLLVEAKEYVLKVRRETGNRPAACWGFLLLGGMEALGEEEEAGRGVSLVLSQGWRQKQISWWEGEELVPILAE